LRAYSEINDFEHDIWRAGGIVIKFWLQISDEEQLKRFEERAQIEHKRFKITEEDWRNREKAGAYHEAVCDMVDRTSSGTAPWTIVESNDKYVCPDQGLADDLRTSGKGTESRPDEGGEGSVTPRPARAEAAKAAAAAHEAKADSGKEAKSQDKKPESREGEGPEPAKDLRAPEKAERRPRRPRLPRPPLSPRRLPDRAVRWPTT
jgi:hypothetical protein